MNDMHDSLVRLGYIFSELSNGFFCDQPVFVSLSEIPKCNPHLTITAYSIALAEALVKSRRAFFSLRFLEPMLLTRELDNARFDLEMHDGDFTVRQEGQEIPRITKTQREDGDTSS